ncbi:MAG: hypothetical protein IK108_03680 [Clostridia bacterium]|nr:hypothetical protein [Clostridia bacterium]
MNREYSLSAVICAVDETFMLEQTFQKLDGYGGAEEYLFVLAKTCTPGCLATVERLCARSDCRWVYQTGEGLGNAIRESFFMVNGTHLVIWSADEATDVSSFPEMLRLSKENPEKIIKISRWLRKDGFEGYGYVKKCLNYVSQRFFGLLFHSKLTEFTNPTQICPVAVYRGIRWNCTGFDFLPEMTFKPLKLGIEFIEVPTKNVPRLEGRSHHTLLSHIRYYRTVMKIFFTRKQDLIKETSD